MTLAVPCTLHSKCALTDMHLQPRSRYISSTYFTLSMRRTWLTLPWFIGNGAPEYITEGNSIQSTVVSVLSSALAPPKPPSHMRVYVSPPTWILGEPIQTTGQGTLCSVYSAVFQIATKLAITIFENRYKNIAIHG